LSRRARDKPFVPRIGVVWTPWPAISLYGSYSESFSPVLGAGFDGIAFVPETGVAKEIGAKFSFLNRRVAATIAAFDMARENVTTADPDHPGFNIQAGEQTSKGIEVEVDGELTPGWRVTVGYSFLDAVVSRDNNLLVGQQLRNVARHGANLFTTYRLEQGPLEGLGVSLGVAYEGRRSGAVVNASAASTAYSLPSYMRVDVGASLRRERYDLILGINNVLDKTYFSGALNRNMVFYGDGRTVSLIGKVRL
jgi:iron complex outermembrane receptor protein